MDRREIRRARTVGDAYFQALKCGPAVTSNELLRGRRMPICEIRQADPSDSARVAKLLDAAFTPLRTIYAPTREAVQRQEQLPSAMRVVAEVAGRVVATVEVDQGRHNLHLVGFAVHPSFQRQGIGRALVDWIAAHLTAPAIELATIRETGNVRVFERMGFKVVGEKVADWCVSAQFDRLHEVTMSKSLASID